jgi:ribosomal protein S21
MMAVKVLLYQQQCLIMADSRSRSRTNNNTATAALRRFRQPVNEGWPAYEAILEQYRKHRFYLSWSQSWFS